ncbi:hypothetical protein NP233_g8798 [Leucocoprinus birnbaumii]|uniref:Protein kinase domain-containing protein n=1 Tax=Leucocoprinus birnbaumii TaxID=56174 RepID=A0AAD5YTI0_9AGAR|nr:hypothetical protein NP233_g8798 [Leucocoprinus birnbaumii]
MPRAINACPPKPQSLELYAYAAHLHVNSDDQLSSYVYEVYDADEGDLCDITFAPNGDILDDSGPSHSTECDRRHPWAAFDYTNTCQENDIDETHVLELLLSRWRAAGFYERAQIAREVTSRVFYKESSWIDFDDDDFDSESCVDSDVASATGSGPGISDLPLSSESVSDEDEDKVQTPLEDLLADMLNDCMNGLPLSAFPLQAPEFDDEFIASLCLPVIHPLTSSHGGLPSHAKDDISEVLNDYADRAWSYRPLPVAESESAEQNDPMYPPPYLSPVLSGPSPPGSTAEAPPPFPQEITDLLRMAASLLYKEIQSNLYTVRDLRDHKLGTAQNGSLLSHLETLRHLVASCPDKVLSVAEGAETFKDALKDGVVLDIFLEYLMTSDAFELQPNTADCGVFDNFIQTYEALCLPSIDKLKYLDLEDISLEDVAAYARAIIQLHGRFGSATMYDKLGSLEPISSVITGGDQILADKCSTVALPELIPLADNRTNLEANVLPPDEAVLYQELISMIRDEEKLIELLHQEDKSEAQSIIDLIQHMLRFPQVTDIARKELLTVLLRLSTATALYPRTFRLADDPQVNKEPITCGYYGDILRGYVQEQCVCVKVVKVYRKGSKSQKFLKSFMREIVIWGQLEHPNILPFYGVYHLDNAEQRICLVSPWMENGTLVDFLKVCPPDTNKLLLVKDIVSGLEYLHDKMIVHGDLKGINILVTLCGRACLTDFGLASTSNTGIVFPSTLESTGHQGATPRYEAPELLIDCEETVHRTTSSDMYAFGGVCYEIFTGNVPFYECAAPYTIISKIIKGETPSRPAESEFGATDQPPEDIWSIMNSCWSPSPCARPSATDILLSRAIRFLLDERPEDQETWSSTKYGYRASVSSDSDPEDDDNEQTAEENRLWFELDIASRRDTAVYKPNPFSIAKINAIARASAVPPAPPAPPMPKQSSPRNGPGTLDHFFKAHRNFIREKRGKSIPAVVNDSNATSIKGPVANVAERRHKAPDSGASIDRPMPFLFTPASLSAHKPHSPVTNHAHISTKPDDAGVNLDLSLGAQSTQPHIPECIPSDLPSHPVSNQRDGKGAREVHLPSPVKPASWAATNFPKPKTKVKTEAPTTVLPTPQSLSIRTQTSPQPRAFSTSSHLLRQVCTTSLSGRNCRASDERVLEPRPGNTLHMHKAPKIAKVSHGDSLTARPKESHCYDFGQNDDESWSTLPLPKKKFKPRFLLVFSMRLKSSGPFRIPGLMNNVGVQKTGMSSTSAARVITFLPTPLLVDDIPQKVECKLEGNIQQFSSPPSSPISKFWHGSLEEVDVTLDRPSSPPTSDPAEEDTGTLELAFNSGEVEAKYLKILQKIHQHKSVRQFLWDALELPSCCYVRRDSDVDNGEDIRILSWSALLNSKA